MEGPWSAPQPHQVIGMAWRFAAPTGGPMPRSHIIAHSTLNSTLTRRPRLAGVCRLRNNVADVPIELLKRS